MMSLLLFFALSAPAPQPPAPDPVDILSWFSPDAYPEAALRAKAQGIVAFEVQVDMAGRPGRCVVTTSSGHRSLDEGTCAIVARRGRFRPAAGPDGKPVASTFASKVSWKIPATALHSYQAVIVDIPEEDSAPQCRVEASEMLPDEANACAQALKDIAREPETARLFRRVVFLLMHTDDDTPPYPTDPSWGERLSRVVSEQTRLGASSFPIACTTVIAEGFGEGVDACAGFPHRKRPLTPEEAALAEVGRMEMSTFAVRRE